MFNRKFRFMFGILAAGIALTFFILPSHKVAAQQSYNTIRLVNDTSERVCSVLMLHNSNDYYIVSGWYCVNSNDVRTITRLTTDLTRVYFYAKSNSRIWSIRWNRDMDLPQGGQPYVIDIENGFGYSFKNARNGLENSRRAISAGFKTCASRLAQDCRSIAAVPTTAQSRNNTLTLTFSDIDYRARQSVLEW